MKEPIEANIKAHSTLFLEAIQWLSFTIGFTIDLFLINDIKLEYSSGGTVDSLIREQRRDTGQTQES